MLDGEGGTPTMPLSLPRNNDAFSSRGLSLSASSAHSASSLLSESFFRKKLKDSVDEVMEKLKMQDEGRLTITDLPADHHHLSASDVVSCGNSIAVESEYSHSQADGQDDDKHAPEQVAFVFVICGDNLITLFIFDSRSKKMKLL